MPACCLKLGGWVAITRMDLLLSTTTDEFSNSAKYSLNL